MTIQTEILLLKAAVVIVLISIVWHARDAGREYGGLTGYVMGGLMGLLGGVAGVALVAAICFGGWFLFT
jgi:hypothetical protein